MERQPKQGRKFTHVANMFRKALRAFFQNRREVNAVMFGIAFNQSYITFITAGHIGISIVSDASKQILVSGVIWLCSMFTACIRETRLLLQFWLVAERDVKSVVCIGKHQRKTKVISCFNKVYNLQSYSMLYICIYPFGWWQILHIGTATSRQARNIIALWNGELLTIQQAVYDCILTGLWSCFMF